MTKKNEASHENNLHPAIGVLELPQREGNPRNSEGAFITLKDGRIMFVYSHYTAGNGGDHDPAFLAGRFSSDGGQTWTTDDVLVVSNEGGMNVMSVNLLRLQSGGIALFYLLKNSGKDCRPVMRLSHDEGSTWTPPVSCITDEVGYYVMNNDRAIQLSTGRIVLPVCLHARENDEVADWNGTCMCYLSDDDGQTWRRSKSIFQGFDLSGNRVSTQEPGVVELRDGRLMMVIRSNGLWLYLSWSADGGDTWSAPVKSDLQSPISPASIKRLPSTGDLLLVWNNHDGIAPHLAKLRVPLSTAISQDEGKTWRHIKVLEGNPDGWFCYVAIHPLEDVVLLGYCAGLLPTIKAHLGHSRITRIPVAWFYS